VHKRYVKRGEKLYGPYFYESFRDEEGKWKCIFCVYNTGKSGTTCDYQSRILSFYQQWKKYYADEETGETGGAA